MSLVHYKPVNLFNQFNDEMNRHFSMTREGAANQEHAWQPAVDIREEENCYLITADVPGVNSKDIDVALEDGVLSIKGERNTETEVSEAGYRRRERTHGTFMRQFTLPDTVDANSISATARDGVLEVTIPKQEKPAAKKIAVS
jgi:HSP20 family protein